MKEELHRSSIDYFVQVLWADFCSDVTASLLATVSTDLLKYLN